MLQRWCRLQWHELHWLQIVKQWLYQFLKRKKIGVFLWVRNVVQNFIWHPVARFARWEYLPWPAPVIRTTLFSNSAMTDFFLSFVDFCKSGLTGVCQTPQHMIIRKDNASKNRSNYVRKITQIRAVPWIKKQPKNLYWILFLLIWILVRILYSKLSNNFLDKVDFWG